jgi:hypothetical protein
VWTDELGQTAVAAGIGGAYQLAKVVNALAQNRSKAEVKSTLNLLGD